MRKICALATIVTMIFAAAGPIALADPITDYASTIWVHTTYNAYGVAIDQTSTTDSTTTTTGDLYVDGQNHVLTRYWDDRDKDAEVDEGEYQYYYIDEDNKSVGVNEADVRTIAGGSTSTTCSVSTVTSEWHNGSLHAVISDSTSETTTAYDFDEDKKADYEYLSSKSETTDYYSYDAAGALTACSGSGTYKSYSMYLKDGERVTYNSGKGTITETYEIRDGQALLTKSETDGGGEKGDLDRGLFDKDGNKIGTFSNTTTVTSWVYAGGQWLSESQESVNESEVTGQSRETITRTTNYIRDENGTLTGIVQTAVGDQYVTRTGGEIHYTLEGYSATVSFDDAQGYYISEEEYTWRRI